MRGRHHIDYRTCEGCLVRVVYSPAATKYLLQIPLENKCITPPCTAISILKKNQPAASEEKLIWHLLLLFFF